MTVWYIARGAGLSALVLLSISTCIGALVTGRGGRPGNRVVVQYLHRVTASLGLGVLLLHIATIFADSYANVGWTGAIVPFTAGYRPTWVAFGTLSVYTFVLVAAIGLARGRMAASKRGAAAWRWLHSLAYVGWGMAMVHGLKSGTDTSVHWVRLLYLACGIAVIASVAVRVLREPDLEEAPEAAVPGSAPSVTAGAR